MKDTEGLPARAAPLASIMCSSGSACYRSLQSSVSFSPVVCDRSPRTAISTTPAPKPRCSLKSNGPCVRGDDLSDGITSERIAALDEILSSNGVTASVVRLKIWNREHVVYSNAHDLIGKAFPTSDELEGALNGEVESESQDMRNDTENVDERKFGSLLETLVPTSLLTRRTAGRGLRDLPTIWSGGGGDGPRRAASRS